jgi:hypothetical protein
LSLGVVLPGFFTAKRDDGTGGDPRRQEAIPMLKDAAYALAFVALFFVGGILFATAMHTAMQWNPVLAAPGLIVLFVLIIVFSALHGEHTG